MVQCPRQALAERDKGLIAERQDSKAETMGLVVRKRKTNEMKMDGEITGH